MRAAVVTALLVLAGILTVLPGAAVAQRPPGPSAPEGGPVDDGWLPGPDPSSAAFAGFPGEPPAGGDPVWPGVLWDARRTTLADSRPVDVHIFSLDPAAPVEIRPTLAGGSVGHRLTVADQSGDPLLGAVAAVNGGFWLRDPAGEPNGYFAIDGRLVSDSETQGAGPRGTVGWTADGHVVIDRLDSRETVTLADGRELSVNGVNRGRREYDEMFSDGNDTLFAYTTDYRHPIPLTAPRQPPPPPGTAPDPPPPIDLAAIRVQVERWPATGSLTGTVTGVTRDKEASFTTGPGEVILIATGALATALDGLAEGHQVALGTQLLPRDPATAAAWTTITRGIASGPLVVKGSQVTPDEDWVSEGFEPQVHSNVRAPRTAIGVTADGQTLLVIADGRRPGITHGFTIRELGEYMIALGAVDALSLDGGASSQFVVDGIMRNVPCCDASTRVVATSLQIVHHEPWDHVQRHRGAGRVDTAIAIAHAAYPQGTTEAVIAVSSSYADGLAGGPLAAVLGGPLLLTAQNALPQVTALALQDLGVERVHLLGGEAVIGPEVGAELDALGIQWVRVAGDSRYDTAAGIARLVLHLTEDEQIINLTPRRAFLAYANGFADALAAAGPGGILDMPILLTGADDLHHAAADVLEDLDEVVLVGGTSRLSEEVEEEVRDLGPTTTRLAGESRFATARAVNDWLRAQATLSPHLVVATGATFPDALAGGPLAAVRNGQLMIVPSPGIDADEGARGFFADREGAIQTVEVLGGLGVLSSYQQWQLEDIADRYAAPAPPVTPIQGS